MKEIFVERREIILRVAIKSNNELIESIVEESKNEPIIGEIYKGRIKNIIPAINSVFVDLGLDKEGYLYYSDELKAKGIKKGDDILVEVLKEPLNDKGAKLTAKVSIPGKYIVLNCYEQGIEFSKRIEDKEKKIELLRNIEPLKDVCITVRTEGANVDINILKNEISKLYDEFQNIDKKMKHSLGVRKIYGEDLTLTKLLMNFSGEEIIKIYVDNSIDFDKISSFAKGQENLKNREV